MGVEYTWILRQENFFHYMLLILGWFIGHFINPEGGDGVKWAEEGIDN